MIRYSGRSSGCRCETMKSGSYWPRSLLFHSLPGLSPDQPANSDMDELPQVVSNEDGFFRMRGLGWWELAALARSLRNQGRGVGDGWLSHERLGYNYRLADINCALGLVQLARLDEILAERRRVAALYETHLADDTRLSLPRAAAEAEVESRCISR